MRSAENLDQATGLRRLLGADGGMRALGIFGSDAALNAHAGANLATAMAQRGASVAVFDEVPAPMNVASRLGLTPGVGLKQVIQGQCNAQDALNENPCGVRLLRAEQALHSAAGLAPEAWTRLQDVLPETDLDWLFMAAPADEAPSLALAAPYRLLVVPGAKNRLTEAYALLKSLHAQQPEGRWWILFMHLSDDTRASQMMQAITETSRRFLEVEPTYLGCIPHDGKLELAARAMRTVLEFAPASAAACAFRAAAEILAQQAQSTDRLEHADFWKRMGLFGRTLAPRASFKAVDTARGRHYG
jgi:flagellar biosynthesis protein FlhG